MDKKKPNGYWTYERCYEEAQKYESRGEYARGSHSAYNSANKNKWLDDYTWFKEKSKPAEYWTYEKCFEEAKK